MSTTDRQYQSLVHICRRAIDKVTPALMRDYGELIHLQHSPKGPHKFAGISYERIHSELHEHLETARGDFTIGFSGQNQNRFIATPLDGYTNFLRCLPAFTISIAAIIENEIVSTVLFDPNHGELYHATKGGGTYMNDKRLYIGGTNKRDNRESLSEIMAVYSTGDVSDHHRQALNAKWPLQRQSGCCSLDMAWVASSRCNGLFATRTNIEEITAGLLLIREAGGMAKFIPTKKTKEDTTQNGMFIAGNERVFEQLTALTS